MIDQSKIINLLNRALNQSAKLRKTGDVLYFCSQCGHHKRKLEINIDEKSNRFQNYHCWVCNFKGSSLYSLFYALRCRESLFNELKSLHLTKVSKYRKQTSHLKDVKPLVIELPREFIPLYEPQKTNLYNQALTYVLNRRITPQDIIRYNIGYCETGEYKNRIIIPSYDNNFELNYFVGRIFVNGGGLPYQNPPISKNVVGFESFINWNSDHGVTLVEGGFDAIAVKNNAVPLYGKTISTRLRDALIRNNVQRVNIILDNDAQNEAVQMYTMLSKCIKDIHLLILKDKDPSVIGFEKMQDMVAEAKKTTFSDIVKLKLSNQI